MTEPEFEYDRGIHLTGSVVWFDAARYDVLSVVSSARVPNAWRHSMAVCTDSTRTLLRLSRPDFKCLVLPLQRKVALGQFDMTLMPAGYMPGSSMALVTGAHGSVLYANHASLAPHRMAEPPRQVQADTLVLRTAYGLPLFTFPTRAESLDRVVLAARRAIDAGQSPVFLCSPIGKAQEVVRTLVDQGIPVVVHRSIAAVNRVYRSLGFDPGVSTQFRGGIQPGRALVFPDTLRGSRAISGLRRPRLIWLSGMAMVPEMLARMRVDEGIPLSGHLDCQDLERFVDAAGARRVFTVGHWCQDFADSMKRRGVEAKPLHREVQLTLF